MTPERLKEIAYGRDASPRTLLAHRNELVAEVRRLTGGATTALDALRRGQNNMGRQILADLLEGDERR